MNRTGLVILLFLLPALARAQERPSIQLEVLGVEGELKKNVLESLSLADKEQTKSATQAELRHLHSKAEAEIRRALQPFGYYRPFIRSELIANGRWIARYEIEQGPPILLDSVVVALAGEGARDRGYQRRVREFPLRKGDVLNHQAYTRGKAALESYAAEAGYLDATFRESRILVDLERYAASVVVRVDTGPKHYFGEINFDRDVLKPHLLARYPSFRPGDPFDYRKLVELQTDLSATGYFTRVEVRPAMEVEQHRVVPIDVLLAPAKKLRLTGGLGYGTDDGYRVRGVIELRRTNREGHRAQIELQYGQRDKRAGLQYFIPWPHPRTDVVTFSTGWQDLRTPVSESKLVHGGASLSRALGQWRATPALNWRRETFTVGTDRGTVVTLLPEGTWSRVRADDRIDTRNGDRVSLNVRGAHEAVLSDVTLLQERIEAKLIHGIGSASRGLLRLEAGATRTNDFRRLPPSLRFFAGGTNSVRGYGYNSLGPRDENGRVIGGRYLLAGSVELDHRFFHRWGGAVFFDIGNALNDWGDELKRGAGVGLRWTSPAGPVRVDFGWGLDRERTPLTVHVWMGPEL